ncbi:MAG: ABC transporter substrate-binding protein [Oscillospiraceae bacterium]|nr:ABC transporter substrate-binding protein [Oscillospiraceae bacterium]
MSKKLIKSISLILVLIMAVGLIAACTPAANDPDTTNRPDTGGPVTDIDVDGDDITVEAEGPEAGANLADHIDMIKDGSTVTVVNPNLPAGGTVPTAWIYEMVHDRLVEIRGPGEYIPGLALSWETEDYQNIRFNLRQGVTWHNGDPFTADCVVFTIEVAREHPAGTAFARWRVVESITAVDRYTVDMVLESPDVDFLFMVSHWATPILNQSSFEANPDDPMWAAIGTGPFQITDFSSGDFITIERFDGFWGDPAPTRSITMWAIPEMAARAVMLQNGDAQLSMEMLADDLDRLSTHPDFNVIEDLLAFPVPLGFNSQGDAIMRCHYFRRAVAHALYLPDIAMAANGNWAIPLWDGTLWGLRTPYRRNDIPAWEFNQDLAREYLERSVYNGEQITMITAGAGQVRGAEMIQHQLSLVGIDIFVDIMDIPSLVSATIFNPESTNQMILFALGFSPSAVGSMTGVFYPNVGNNRLNLDNPHLNELIRALAAEPDVEIQRQIAYDIQEFFWEDLTALPLWHGVLGIAHVEGIGGMHLWGDTFRYSLRGMFWDLNYTPENLRP